MAARKLEIRGNLESAYSDVFTPEAVVALEALTGLDADRKAVMAARIDRRAARAQNRQRIAFLDPQATVARTGIKVHEARAGAFTGAEVPGDLQRQWVQGTGPAAKPNASPATTHGAVFASTPTRPGLPRGFCNTHLAPKTNAIAAQKSASRPPVN